MYLSVRFCSRSMQNEIHRSSNVRGLKTGIATATATTTTTTTFTAASKAVQRAALGDLANKTARTVNSGLIKINGDQKACNENIIVKDLKTVKPRVDTRWTNQPSRKPLTRSTSTSQSNILKGSVAATVAEGPKLVRTRSTSTAVKKEACIVNIKADAAKIEKKSDEKRTIKREDSNLSKKVISKIRSSTHEAIAIATAEVKVPPKPLPNYESIQNEHSHSRDLLNKVRLIFASVNSGILSGFVFRFPFRVQFHDDIDAGDELNTLLVSEYVNDIYAYLYHLERVYAIEKDHLAEQRDVLPKMRSVLIDWINEVHQQYRFVQETFHMAVSIIDRYLQVRRILVLPRAD